MSRTPPSNPNPADPSTDEPTRLGPPTGATGPYQPQPEAIGGYRVEKLLGAGGMGSVYLAHDATLDRPVAVKTMKPEVAAQPGAVERFLREARAAARVAHDNVIPILHVGEHAGTPYIAMPLLEGEPLNALIKRDPTPPLGVVLKVGRETADGLAAAHAKGLIHRDIKPANIWVEGEAKSADWVRRFRRVKVLDFGLARPAVDDTHLTGEGAVMGTPAYMSPEQARAKPLDGRTDVFSLGVVLYRMLTGAMPFAGGSYSAILTSLAVDTPVPAAERNPQVPLEVSALVARMLARKPDERPSAAEVAAELRAIGQRLASGSLPQVVAYPLPSGAADDNPFTELNSNSGGAQPAVDAPAATRGRSLGMWAAAALALLVAAALVVTVVLKVGRTPNGPPLPPESKDPKSPKDPKGPERLPEDPDREVAQWVLTVANAGAIIIRPDGQGPMHPAGGLPARSFRIVKLIFPWEPYRVTNADMAHLEGLTGLEVLNLNNSAITGVGLARLKNVKSLTALHANRTDVGDDGLEGIKNLTQLTSLGLAETKITDDGLKRLAGFDKLTELSVISTQVRGSGLGHFPNLTRLNACRTKVDDAGLEHIGKLTKLTELTLCDNGRYGKDGLKHLRGLTALRVLNLSGTELRDAAVTPLRALTGLVELHIGGSELTETGLRDLTALTNLERLTVAAPRVNGAALMVLAGLPKLRHVDARGTGVTAAEAVRFYEMTKGCDVVTGPLQK